MINNKNDLTLIRNGKHYDALNNFDYDIPFYLDLLKLYPNSFLELGCGTGRIALPVGKAGYKVVGIDIAEDMLNVANNKIEKGLDVTFFNSDIRKFNLNQKFSVITIAFDSICHLHNFEDIKSFLECVKNHLQLGGRFVIDVANPNYKSFLRDPEAKTQLSTYINPYDGSTVKISELCRYDKVNQINNFTWYYEIDQTITSQTLVKKVFFPSELDNYLKFMGFEITNKYGDFKYSDFNGQSKRQVIVSKI